MAAKPGCLGGYNYQFIDTPSDMLVCQICQYPSREPHLSGCCGHTFCKSCLEAAKRATNISQACPICRSEEFITMPHKQADRAIRSLHVFCTNKDKGCEWQGEVNDIINHLGNSDGCQYEVVACFNDCGKCLQRQYLNSHVEDECAHRKVECQYCHITGEHQFIEGEHKEQCPKFLIACPNKCAADNMLREDIDEHRKMCPLELIQCKYHLVGCEERMARKDQKKHNKEKMEDHLSFTKQTLQTANSELTEMAKHFANTQSQLAYTKADLKSTQEEARKTKDNLTQQLAVTKQEAKRTKDELTNTERDLSVTKQQLATTCQNLTIAEKEHITLAANTDEALAKLETKFQTKITEVETAAQKRITELETKLEHKTQHIELIISDPILSKYTNIIYQASKSSSGDQVVPVIVKMSEYTKKKSDKVEWYSDSFYTHHKGYKMCLRVFAVGYDHYMSVYLYLMKGPYDNQLRWPLKGYCEVKLLNQISNSEHHLGNGVYYDGGHKRVTSGYNVSTGEISGGYIWHTHQFISHDHLHKITPTCQYLKDDSIFLQVDYVLKLCNK